MDEKLHSGFDDHEGDDKCPTERAARRIALLTQIETLAAMALGEHMTPRAWEIACRASWNRAIRRIEKLGTMAPGDPETPIKELD